MANDTSEAPAGRALRRRASGPVGVITAYVPPALARAARVYAAEQGCTVSALVARLLEQHLAEGEAAE